MMPKRAPTILLRTMRTNNAQANEKKSRYGIRFIILAAAFVVIFCVSLILGRYSLSLPEILQVVASKLPGSSVGVTWTEAAEAVLFEIRFPRVAAAALIGAALSLAGVCYQGMFRNPIVSPDILGASTGAGFGASLAIVMSAGYMAICTTSFAFGLAAVLMAYLVSRLAKGDETLALILGGMVISSLFGAGSSFVKLVADTQEQLPAITYWLMGSLSSIRKENIQFIILPMIIGMVPLFLLSWRLNLLTIQEESAKSMGINLKRLRMVVIFCATLLTAVSVSVSGMIGWVGLVIPHFCRMIFGYDYRRLIPSTALFGAAFLLAVDNAARLTLTQEIPLGILTSVIGAPIFLYLLIKKGGRRG